MAARLAECWLRQALERGGNADWISVQVEGRNCTVCQEKILECKGRSLAMSLYT